MAPMAGLQPTLPNSIATPAASSPPRAASSKVASHRRCSRRGRLSVAKTLKADDVGLHIHAYGHRPEPRPTQADPASPYMVSFDDQAPAHGAVGHLPLRRQTL
jgi:hypothetical protein